jgi:hypothetical protein
LATLFAPASGLLLPASAKNVKSESFGTNAVQEYQTGCIRTSTFISISRGWTKDASGNATQNAFLGIEVEQADTCAGTQIRTGVADVVLDPGHVNLTLKGTSISTTVDVFDNETLATIPFDIDLTWTGVGKKSSITETFHFGNGGNCRTHFVERPVVISGTVSSGGVIYASDPWDHTTITSGSEVCTT